MSTRVQDDREMAEPAAAAGGKDGAPGVDDWLWQEGAGESDELEDFETVLEESAELEVAVPRLPPRHERAARSSPDSVQGGGGGRGGGGEALWLGLGMAGSLVLHVALLTLVVTTGGWEVVSPTAARTPWHAAQIEAVPQQDPLGLRGGLGEAVAQFDAEQALRAAQALQDQPWLGMTTPGPTLHARPAAETLERLDRAVELPPMASLSELSSALEAGRPGPAAAVESEEGQAPAGDAGQAAAVPETSPGQTPRPQQTAAVGGGDPGAAAGREVDLFAREAVADFRAGQTVAREGRDHRIRGLRRGLSAYFDQALLPRPIIIRYRIEVDEEGTPLRIDVVKSSGSDALDLEVRRQLFLSWFDPDPSGDGSDLGRPFLFTLRIV